MRLINKSLTESLYTNLKVSKNKKTLKEGSFGEEVGFMWDADVDAMKLDFAKRICSYLGIKDDDAEYFKFNTFELHRGTSWVDSNPWMAVEIELPYYIVLSIIEANARICPLANKLNRSDYLNYWSDGGIDIGRTSGTKSFKEVYAYFDFEESLSSYDKSITDEEVKFMDKNLEEEEEKLGKYVADVIKEHYDELLDIMLDNEFIDEEELEESEKITNTNNDFYCEYCCNIFSGEMKEDGSMPDCPRCANRRAYDTDINMTDEERNKPANADVRLLKDGDIGLFDGNTVLDELGSDYEGVLAMYDLLGYDIEDEFIWEDIVDDADSEKLYIKNGDFYLDKDGKTVVYKGRDSANFPIVSIVKGNKIKESMSLKEEVNNEIDSHIESFRGPDHSGYFDMDLYAITVRSDSKERYFWAYYNFSGKPTVYPGYNPSPEEKKLLKQMTGAEDFEAGLDILANYIDKNLDRLLKEKNKKGIFDVSSMEELDEGSFDDLDAEYGSVEEENGKKYYVAGSTQQGYCYKSVATYKNSPDEVCYISESAFDDNNAVDGKLPLDYVEKNKNKLIEVGSVSTHNSILEEVRSALVFDNYNYTDNSGKVIEAKDFDNELIEMLALEAFEIVDWQGTGSFIGEQDYKETIEEYYSHKLNESVTVKKHKRLRESALPDGVEVTEDGYLVVKDFIYYFIVGVAKIPMYSDEDDSEGWVETDFNIPFKVKDENYGVLPSLEMAVEYVKSYVESGIPGTCGVVVECKTPDYVSEMDADDKDRNIYNGFAEWVDPYDIYHYKDSDGKVVYSAYTDENSNLIETTKDTSTDKVSISYSPSPEVYANLMGLKSFVEDKSNRELFKSDGIDEEVIDLVNNIVKGLKSFKFKSKNDFVSSLEHINSFIDETKEYFYDGIDIDIKEYVNSVIESAKKGIKESFNTKALRRVLKETTDEEINKLKVELKNRAEDLYHDGDISFELDEKDLDRLAYKIKLGGFFISNNIFTDNNDEYEWQQINDFLDDSIRDYAGEKSIRDKYKDLSDLSTTKDFKQLADSLDDETLKNIQKVLAHYIDYTDKNDDGVKDIIGEYTTQFGNDYVIDWYEGLMSTNEFISEIKDSGYTVEPRFNESVKNLKEASKKTELTKFDWKDGLDGFDYYMDKDKYIYAKSKDSGRLYSCTDDGDPEIEIEDDENYILKEDKKTDLEKTIRSNTQNKIKNIRDIKDNESGTVVLNFEYLYDDEGNTTVKGYDIVCDDTGVYDLFADYTLLGSSGETFDYRWNKNDDTFDCSVVGKDCWFTLTAEEFNIANEDIKESSLNESAFTSFRSSHQDEGFLGRLWFEIDGKPYTIDLFKIDGEYSLIYGIYIPDELQKFVDDYGGYKKFLQDAIDYVKDSGYLKESDIFKPFEIESLEGKSDYELDDYADKLQQELKSVYENDEASALRYDILDLLNKKEKANNRASGNGLRYNKKLIELIHKAEGYLEESVAPKKPKKKKKGDKKDEKRVIMQQGNVTCIKESNNKFLVFENENDNEKEYKDQDTAMADFLQRVGVDPNSELTESVKRYNLFGDIVVLDTDNKKLIVNDKEFTFDKMDEFVKQARGSNRLYKPMALLLYTDYKNGKLKNWESEAINESAKDFIPELIDKYVENYNKSQKWIRGRRRPREKQPEDFEWRYMAGNIDGMKVRGEEEIQIFDNSTGEYLGPHSKYINSVRSGDRH